MLQAATGAAPAKKRTSATQQVCHARQFLWQQCSKSADPGCLTASALPLLHLQCCCTLGLAGTKALRTSSSQTQMMNSQRPAVVTSAVRAGIVRLHAAVQTPRASSHVRPGRSASSRPVPPPAAFSSQRRAPVARGPLDRTASDLPLSPRLPPPLPRGCCSTADQASLRATTDQATTLDQGRMWPIAKATERVMSPSVHMLWRMRYGVRSSAPH